MMVEAEADWAFREALRLRAEWGCRRPREVSPAKLQSGGRRGPACHFRELSAIQGWKTRLELLADYAHRRPARREEDRRAENLPWEAGRGQSPEVDRQVWFRGRLGIH